MTEQTAPTDPIADPTTEPMADPIANKKTTNPTGLENAGG